MIELMACAALFCSHLVPTFESVAAEIKRIQTEIPELIETNISVAYAPKNLNKIGSPMLVKNKSTANTCTIYLDAKNWDNWGLFTSGLNRKQSAQIVRFGLVHELYHCVPRKYKANHSSTHSGSSIYMEEHYADQSALDFLKAGYKEDYKIALAVIKKVRLEGESSGLYPQYLGYASMLK